MKWTEISEVAFGGAGTPYVLYLSEDNQRFNYRTRENTVFIGGPNGMSPDALQARLSVAFYNLVAPIVRKALEERADPSISPHSK